MRIPWSRRAASLVLHILLAACGSSHSTGDNGTTTLRTGALTVTVHHDPFSIAVSDRRGLLLAEAPAMEHGSLTYWRTDGQFYLLRSRTPPVRSGDRVTFEVETSEAADAIAGVVIDLSGDGQFSVELTPPQPESVSEVGDSFVADADERYYGLTERIVSDGPIGPASEVAPQEVGSLDRRGEAVRISVAATIAIYTPFLHSSRGYGLFVDGPMEGVFDLAKADPDRVAGRFNFDPTAQRFRYHVLYGPGQAAILHRYTALTGRPWLPPRRVHEHMRLRDEP